MATAASSGKKDKEKEEHARATAGRLVANERTNERTNESKRVYKRVGTKHSRPRTLLVRPAGLRICKHSRNCVAAGRLEWGQGRSKACWCVEFRITGKALGGRSGGGRCRESVDCGRVDEANAGRGGVEWSGVEWSGVEWDGMEWSGWLSFRAFFLAGWPARTDTGEMEELSGKQGTASMLSRLQVK